MPNPNGTLTDAEIILAREYAAQMEETLSSAQQLHQVLLDQVNALKDARKETVNLYELNDKIKELQEERKKIAFEEIGRAHV